MLVYRRFLFPALRRFDPETTHDLTLRALAFAQQRRAGRALLRTIAGQLPERPVELFGLHFANELGVAAGFDKNVQVATGLGQLGFGHVEVGTLTPRPQKGNARPRVFRLPEDRALINRMGFPNDGVMQAGRKLREHARCQDRPVIGVSLGKQKETTLEDAAGDYLAVMNAVFSYADYLAVNISSPNTPGLRDLQSRSFLSRLLLALMDGNRTLAAQFRLPVRPLILKISPDLAWKQLDHVLEAADEQGISGIVATNTTLARPGLTSPRRSVSGGLSGSPLRERSTEMIRYIRRESSGRMPVIGVGGVTSAADVKEKLDAGATLVQMYTGLVYEGPGVAGRILRSL